MRTNFRSAIVLLAALFILDSFLNGPTLAHSGVVVTDPVRRAAANEVRIWVFLSDKGPDALHRLSPVSVAPRTESRIQLRGSVFDPAVDLPIHYEYRDQLRDAGMVFKNESRWLNAVTGWIHPDDLDLIASLPFVDSLKPVVTYRRTEPDIAEIPSPPLPIEPAGTDVYNYGVARPQLALIGVNYLHAAGYTGKGVRIGFLDTGYSLGIRAFDCINVLGTRDFIDGDNNVGDGVGSQDSHGTSTLSLCGGYDEGELIGVALDAEYVLAKTEIFAEEIQAEEDNWVAGLEWLDSMGCDIVSSSLGYINWYDDDDLDGNTAVATIAADLAVQRGILVVNAAGNSGCGGGGNKLIAPADGDSVLTVGACDLNSQWAVFSSCGPTADGRIKPDVLAPGQGVRTAQLITGIYRTGNGTSFATPLVSGVSALILEHNPALTPYDIITIFRNTSDHAFKPLSTYGWGVINAVKAIGLDTNTIVPDAQFSCLRTNAIVELWPNPASELTAITLTDGTRSDGVYRIFTIAGALVYEGELIAGRAEWRGQTTSDGDAAPGIYLVQVSTEYTDEIVKLAWLPRN